MKKRILFTILLCSLAFNVNAKEEYIKETTMNINSSGTLKFDMQMKVNSELLDKYNLTRDDIFDLNTYNISLSAKGYDVQYLYDNNYSGITITKTFPNISNNSKLGKTEFDLSDIARDDYNDSIMFQKKLGLFFNTYVGNFNFDYTGIKSKEEISLNDIKKIVTSKFVVYLPNKAKTSNASVISEDKQILTWDLVLGKNNNINYEFKVINMTTVIIALFVGFLALIFIVVMLVKLGSKKLDKFDEMKPKKEKKLKVKKEKFKKKNNNGFDEIEKNNAIDSNHNFIPQKENNSLFGQKNIDNTSINNAEIINKSINNEVIEPINSPASNESQVSSVFNSTPVNNETPVVNNSIKQEVLDNNVFNSTPINNMVNNETPVNNIFNAEPINSPINNQVKPDLMAPQNPNLIATQRNLFREEPINNPINNISNNYTPDYTNVFNPSFDDINNNQNNNQG